MYILTNWNTFLLTKSMKNVSFRYSSNQQICQAYKFTLAILLAIFSGVFPNCVCRLGKVYDHQHSVRIELIRVLSIWRR